MHVNFIIFHFLFFLTLLLACRKFDILIDLRSENHKRFSSNTKTFIIGGFFIIFFLNYYFFLIEKNLTLCLFLSSIFSIGLMSDLKKLNNVSLRFLMQVVLVVCFVNYLNIEINSTKIALVDSILKYQLINIFFTSFCLIVLINGSNFIDGINCNNVTYFLLILIILLFNFDHAILNKEILINFLIILLTILLLNGFGIIYLGDSGSYTLSLFFGIFLINFSSLNNAISPYFVIVLLWYPCFELLFSMIRRSFKEIKTYEPDTNHLHQLIYKNFKLNSKIKNNLVLHFLTSSTINIYNLFCFLISLKYIYQSEVLLIIVIINVILYIISYNFLKK